MIREDQFGLFENVAEKLDAFTDQIIEFVDPYLEPDYERRQRFEPDDETARRLR